MVWRGAVIVFAVLLSMAISDRSVSQNQPTIIDVVVEPDFDPSGRQIWRTEVTFQDGVSIFFTCEEDVRDLNQIGLSTFNQGDAITCSQPSEPQPQSPEAQQAIQQAVLQVLANLSPAGVGSGSDVLANFLRRQQQGLDTQSFVERQGQTGENESQDTDILLSTLPLCSEIASPIPSTNCRLE